MSNVLPPIPQDKIGETHKWREWFFNLGTYITLSQTTSGFSILDLSVAGSSNITLTTNQATSNVLHFTGVLTASIQVIVPASKFQWTVYNNTSGNFTLTFKASSGTGLILEQGSRGIFYFDGTNIVRANDSVAV